MIDTNLMTEKLGIKDMNILKMLLGEFFNVCTNDVEQIDKIIKDRDFQKIRHHAHSIKGAAKNLWIVKCGNAAELLENCAKDDDESNLDNLFAELKEVFYASKAEFEKLA